MANASLTSLRKLPKHKINKDFTKDQLIELITKEPENTDTFGSSDIVTALNNLTSEIKDMRADQATINASVQSQFDTILVKQTTMQLEVDQVKEFKDILKRQNEVLLGQQIYLEKLDYKDRIRNVIITGVPESDDIEQERAKVKDILAALGFPEITFEAKRIGKIMADRVRPLIIRVESGDVRNEIVKNGPKLADIEEFKMIRVKKDQDPAIRREWKRLFDSERDEKAKPENAGLPVVFDKKNRTITRNGMVIDSWKLSFL